MKINYQVVVWSIFALLFACLVGATASAVTYQKKANALRAAMDSISAKTPPALPRKPLKRPERDRASEFLQEIGGETR